VSDIDWELIGPALKAGRYNLLIGAGVSLDSQSGIPRENCPSAGVLTEILQKALPRVRKGSSLNRLYRTLTDEQTESLITQRFSNCQPGPSVEAITSFRWKRIFTLNVDDALEAAYDKQSLPVQSYKTFNFVDPYEEIRDLTTVPIIHLHGWARRPKDKYVFDINEYMGSINNHNLWSRVLASLIRSEPFFVIGSSLEEPDLTYFMSDRFNVRSRVDRAPSILVEYNPDAATEVDCIDYKMSLYHGDTVSFLNKLNEMFPLRPSVDDATRDNLGDVADLQVDPKALAEFHADFERVPASPIGGTDGGTSFAYGYQPTWLDIQNNHDISRPETGALLPKIFKLSGKSIPIVSGGAGAGKTTILKRLAWNVAQSHATCLWVRAVGRIRVGSALEILNAISGDIYIFIDNIADSINELMAIRRGLSSRRVFFVGAERNYRLSHIKRIAGETIIDSQPVGHVGALKDNLVDLYKSYGIAAIPTNDLNKFPLENELIAIACCRILNKFEPLSKIVDKSMSDAPRDVECYVFSALASHCFRTGIEYDIISGQFPDYQVDVLADDDGALPLKSTEIFDTEFITPLNEAFSDTILGRFASQRPIEMLSIFTKLAHAIRPRVSVNAIVAGEPCARIASRLFDFDEVVKPLLGIDGAGAFYTETKGEWEWNSRYWHQIAQYRLDLAANTINVDIKRAEAELAVQHARFAKTIERRHQFTMTTIGRVIFGKARLIGSISPADLDEAVKALIEAIKIEREKGRVTIHPFMILFKGLSETIEAGAVLSNEQRGNVRSQLDSAATEFGRDRDLMAEAQRLKRLT
jgi:hypothetical protein